jgi:hypothetical protein
VARYSRRATITARPGIRIHAGQPEDLRVGIDQRHVALPKLYGAPAYARPPLAVAPGPRPFDPDALPLEAFRTADDREAAALSARAYKSSEPERRLMARDAEPGGLRARAFNLRAIAGRLLGGD